MKGRPCICIGYGYKMPENRNPQTNRGTGNYSVPHRDTRTEAANVAENIQRKSINTSGNTPRTQGAHPTTVRKVVVPVGTRPNTTAGSSRVRPDAQKSPTSSSNRIAASQTRSTTASNGQITRTTAKQPNTQTVRPQANNQQTAHSQSGNPQAIRPQTVQRTGSRQNVEPQTVRSQQPVRRTVQTTTQSRAQMPGQPMSYSPAQNQNAVSRPAPRNVPNYPTQNQNGKRRPSVLGNGMAMQIQNQKRRYSKGSNPHKITVGCVARRSLLVLATALVFSLALIFAVGFSLANAPGETARDMAVMSAQQSSALKWVPYLFLSSDTIEEIKNKSTVISTDERSIDDVVVDNGGNSEAEDKWENAIDGMILETINGKTFKGYVLLVKDPSRVFVGISDKSFQTSTRIFEIADMFDAVAGINGGEFPDNGVKTGTNPMGLTYANGECVWDDGLSRTFFGFAKDNKLFVGEGTTRAEADAMGIRDGVAFQNGNTLITNDGTNVTYYYADSNTGVAQRTAIGQMADGTVILLVTDGRTAASMGATKNDIVSVMESYGAVTAGLLDGGSSAMLYYRNYYDVYNMDKSLLDEWQIMGLVNKYKAFTNPRRIPTFFLVK